MAHFYYLDHGEICAHIIRSMNNRWQLRTIFAFMTLTVPRQGRLYNDVVIILLSFSLHHMM